MLSGGYGEIRGPISQPKPHPEIMNFSNEKTEASNDVLNHLRPLLEHSYEQTGFDASEGYLAVLFSIRTEVLRLDLV